MKTINEQTVTAQVKITKPDGTVTVEEVEMSNEDKQRFLTHVMRGH